MNMKKIIIVFGTRPEAIKFAPIIEELKSYKAKFKPIICVTAQHRQMLDQVLDIFRIKPDFDLNIMSKDQSLFNVTVESLKGLQKVFEKAKPDLILVQGDTTTAFAASLAAYYLKIPIGHVEAGLRTYNKYSPFPEEKNRNLIGVLADYHFAPTEWAKRNLLQEKICEKAIWMTGNTVIDALLMTVRHQKTPARQKAMAYFFKNKFNLNFDGSTDNIKRILVTGHRRENFGDGFRNICMALKKIAANNPDAAIVYPVHLNPNVRKVVYKMLDCASTGLKNVHLIEPLEYDSFIYLLNRSYIVLTDSGGVQEEAPALGKPVLVMRDTTERPEGITAGTAKLVGTKEADIYNETQALLDDATAYEKMSKAANPYGDGKASKRIIDVLLQKF